MTLVAEKHSLPRRGRWRGILGGIRGGLRFPENNSSREPERNSLMQQMFAVEVFVFRNGFRYGRSSHLSYAATVYLQQLRNVPKDSNCTLIEQYYLVFAIVDAAPQPVQCSERLCERNDARRDPTRLPHWMSAGSSLGINNWIAASASK